VELSGPRLISLSLQFAIGIILARLLGPELMGSIAIVLLGISLVDLVAEGRLDSALIPKQIP